MIETIQTSYDIGSVLVLLAGILIALGIFIALSPVVLVLVLVQAWQRL